MSGSHIIRTARSLGELDGMRKSWACFEIEAANADPDYHRTVIEASSAVVRPHVLLAERGGRPAALAVGRIEDTVVPLRIGYKQLLAPRLRTLTVSERGLLGNGDPEAAAAIMDEFREILRRGEAEGVRLRLLTVGSPLYELAAAGSSRLLERREGPPSRRWRASLAGSFQDYLERRSGKTRSNIQRYARKLEREFGDAIAFKVFRDPADFEQLWTDSASVYERTYQHALGVGFSTDAVQSAIAALALERGWFRGFVLYIEGKPSAFWHGIRYGRVFTTGPTGYDTALRNHRIGTYVLARMIDELCTEEDLEWLDFGSGDAEYKSHFGDESWWEQDVVFLSRNPRTVSISAAQAVTDALNNTVRERMSDERLSALKRRWRSRITRSRAEGDG